LRLFSTAAAVIKMHVQEHIFERVITFYSGDDCFHLKKKMESNPMRDKECILESESWPEGTKVCNSCECIVCADGEWEEYENPYVCPEKQ
jgi:hypothetical protein